jgi:hypothetical protein
MFLYRELYFNEISASLNHGKSTTMYAEKTEISDPETPGREAKTEIFSTKTPRLGVYFNY